MENIPTKVGNPIRLRFRAYDGNPNKYVRAIVIDSSGAQIAGSPVQVPHVAYGEYIYDGLTMPDDPLVTAIMEAFEDPSFTVPSVAYCQVEDLYERASDIFGVIGKEPNMHIVGDIEAEVEIEQELEADVGTEDVEALVEVLNLDSEVNLEQELITD